MHNMRAELVCIQSLMFGAQNDTGHYKTQNGILLPAVVFLGKYNDCKRYTVGSSSAAYRVTEGATMSAADARASGDVEGRPLYVCIEMAANLVYLARHSGGDPEQQQKYLDRAAEVLVEIRQHPDCHQ